MGNVVLRSKELQGAKHHKLSRVELHVEQIRVA